MRDKLVPTGLTIVQYVCVCVTQQLSFSRIRWLYTDGAATNTVVSVKTHTLARAAPEHGFDDTTPPTNGLIEF